MCRKIQDTRSARCANWGERPSIGPAAISTPPLVSHRTLEPGPVFSLFGRLVVLCASLTSDRSAELTAASFGNASATSGLRTTTFEASRRRLAYFPRTRGPGKSERRYSARKSFVSVGLIFFIHSLFSLARQASAYDPNRITLFRVSYGQKPATFRCAEGDVSRLGNRVVRVRTGGGQRIAQSRCCFFKRNVVLPQIPAGFLWIPFQCHVRIIPRCESDLVLGRAQEARPVRCDLPAGPPSGAEPRNSCPVHARHRAERVPSTAVSHNHCTRDCGQFKSAAMAPEPT
jgi:hypothetical protein